MDQESGENADVYSCWERFSLIWLETAQDNDEIDTGIAQKVEKHKEQLWVEQRGEKTTKRIFFINFTFNVGFFCFSFLDQLFEKNSKGV